MNKINSGRWSPTGDGVSAQRVAAGIRANPQAFTADLDPERIFVAIAGRSGSYRKKEDIDRLLEQLELDIPYKHDVTEEGYPDRFLYQDEEIHRSVFDGLVDVVNTVYPLVEEVEEAEVKQTKKTKGEDRPF